LSFEVRNYLIAVMITFIRPPLATALNYR